MKTVAIDFATNNQTADTLIIALYQNELNDPLLAQFGVEDLVAALVTQGDFIGKLAETRLVFASGSHSQRLVLVGLGERDKLTVKKVLSAQAAAVKALENTGAKHIIDASVLYFPSHCDQAWSVLQHTQSWQRSFYDYSHPSRGEHTPKQSAITSITYPLASTDSLALAAQQGQATALGMALTQDLGNLPSNICTPAYLADTATQLAKDYGFKATVLERDEMIAMGMGSFMAVAQGTETPPKMICLEYWGANNQDAPITLVGKGVTFDTGGISLKPGAAMDEMKYDMCGAATVLGVFKSLGELKPKVNVVGVIPATDNMPAGNAIKPGDVVTSLSGQTIEILNTDAEGRLILCDALTYAQQTYQPKCVIDMATLTGACIIALGHHVSAVLGNDQTLVDELKAASDYTYDRLWQLPLGEEWDEQLKSNFADMANIGGREAGTITASQFLARFTKNVPWAHLDIAGTAWQSGANKGASGRPVPALVAYLLSKQA
ncbi:leucyl aminopeptidase [Thiomicrospira cyclica]|uniref:Probable cytosol aminopeptidase n=1 Tax=Thiomicrospira cyclica (strain DSM 14477 / JCM 11371 / ALM1) TaxID=717773 RepID=F6DA62_THICA|nr:leucyl aminopeptidase [Thiomicrospira cyclica]AEG32193.1 cytosol aminopeptidase [Thiomicrospira cyclica ALM1]